jgi:hypothetical protein
MLLVGEVFCPKKFRAREVWWTNIRGGNVQGQNFRFRAHCLNRNAEMFPGADCPGVECASTMCPKPVSQLHGVKTTAAKLYE